MFQVRGENQTQRASPIFNVRGVRGEVIWLDCPGHGLTRPVRLLHPRHRVYIVPRSARDVLVGASEIESEDRSPVSLRSATELMAAAHSVLPALAEARILKLDVNLRPALPDNAPRIEQAPRLLRINGLFRHGWLLAPALVEQALRQTGWCDRDAIALDPGACSANQTTATA
jgi:glycine oxidase